jgi:hypothetical protein
MGVMLSAFLRVFKECLRERMSTWRLPAARPDLAQEDFGFPSGFNPKKLPAINGHRASRQSIRRSGSLKNRTSLRYCVISCG